jgi:hypothetical protein
MPNTMAETYVKIKEKKTKTVAPKIHRPKVKRYNHVKSTKQRHTSL